MVKGVKPGHITYILTAAAYHSLNVLCVHVENQCALGLSVGMHIYNTVYVIRRISTLGLSVKSSNLQPQRCFQQRLAIGAEFASVSDACLLNGLNWLHKSALVASALVLPTANWLCFIVGHCSRVNHHIALSW